MCIINKLMWVFYKSRSIKKKKKVSFKCVKWKKINFAHTNGDALKRPMCKLLISIAHHLDSTDEWLGSLLGPSHLANVLMSPLKWCKQFCQSVGHNWNFLEDHVNKLVLDGSKRYWIRIWCLCHYQVGSFSVLSWSHLLVNWWYVLPERNFIK